MIKGTSSTSTLMQRLSVLGREISLTFKAFRSSKLSVVGLVIILALVVIAIIAPLISIEHPTYVLINGQLQQRWPENLGIVLHGPSWSHPFGTNELGTDLYSMVLYGTQIDLILPFEAIVISALIGIVIGGIGGYFEGRIGQVLMRITDAFLAVPSIVLALALVASLGPSLTHIVYAVIATWWCWYARLIYGETRKMKHMDFVEVARSSGLGGLSIFFRHVLSNVLAPAIIQATSDLGSVLLLIAGLSFLGLGAPPGTAEWGLLISVSENYVFTAWWYALFPGLMIAITVIGFNLLGDGLRDVFDPNSRRWMSQEQKGIKKVVHKDTYVGNVQKFLLSVDDLSITYRTFEGSVKAVRNVSFKLNTSEAYGLIGESGSGKSTVASAIMGLLPPESASVTGGDIFFSEEHSSGPRITNLLALKQGEMNQIRGRDIGIIFQEISDSLHPSYRVGFQVGQTYLLHQLDLVLNIATNEVMGNYGKRPCNSCGKELQEGDWICPGCFSVVPPSRELDLLESEKIPDSIPGAKKREIQLYREMYQSYIKNRLGIDRASDGRINEIVRKLVVMDMRKVMIPDPERTFNLYPFELSGGMKQRIMIAMMTASNPKLLIADEPTTALDVVTERNILELIRKLKIELNLSILFISHDLNVIRRICDRVGVIYGGKLVEEGNLAQIFGHALHPYTSGLIDSVPKVKSGGEFVKKGDLTVMEGSVPDMRHIPTGCVFADRCGRVTEECRREEPPFVEGEGGHFAACYHPLTEEAGYAR